MASDAIPAAVPGPNDPPETTPNNGPVSGMLASMLAPVDPARPSFNLDPQAAAEGATGALADTPVTGSSSASYHGAEEGAGKGGTATKTAQQQGIWRAWLLAGAERWRKGGDARNKRLDLAKAKAQANQVKETRTVTVNRTGGLLGNSSGASTGGKSGSGKGLSSKTSGGGSSKGPKNTSGTSRNGSAGRSGGSSGGSGSGGGAGRGSSGGRAGGASGSGSHGAKGHGGTSGSSTGSGSGKPSKAGGPKGSSPSDSGSGSSRSGKGSNTDKSTEYRTARETPFTKDDSNKAGGKKSGSKDVANGKTGQQPDGSSGKDASGKQGSDPKKVSLKKTTEPGKKGDGSTAPAPGPKNSTGKDGTTGKGGAPNPGSTTGGTQPGNTSKNAKGNSTGAAPAGPTGGKPLSTQASRETGYRDGTRAARAVAHAQAYRDGVKDGWTDTKQAADREKTRLDKAHQDRKQARDKDKPVNTTASSADYHQPQPVQVKNVDASHIQLGAGAARESMSRGEVRSLKSFERRLNTKSAALTRIGEETRGLKAHADQQAKQATDLLEAAKAVKGGERLAAALAKLQDAAQVQAGKAEEIHKRAVRSAEACRVLLANAATRYGDIYKAVVNSDETAPAELVFYKG
jgi:hypothetical protein